MRSAENLHDEESLNAILTPGDFHNARQILKLVRSGGDVTDALSAAVALPSKSAVRSYTLAQIVLVLLDHHQLERGLTLLSFIEVPFYRNAPLMKLAEVYAQDDQYDLARKTAYSISDLEACTAALEGVAQIAYNRNLRLQAYSAMREAGVVAAQMPQQVRDNYLDRVASTLADWGRYQDAHSVLAMMSEEQRSAVVQTIEDMVEPRFREYSAKTE